MTVTPVEQVSNSADETGGLPKNSRLLLVTFGKPCVHAESPDGVRIPLTAIQMKHLAALTYIALSPSRTASRQIVAGHLWSESRDKDPRHGLRASLNLLRSGKGLGPEALTSGDKESITLLANVTIDCEQFERLVSEGRYSHAIALYHGKFFADWSVPGAEGFEDWANGKRQHYSSLFCAAASASALHLLSTGQAAAAARIAERLRDEAPGVPDSWRLLLECRIAARDRVHAMSDASQCEKLAREGDIEMDAALRALVRRAKSGTPESVEPADERPHTLLTPDMVGREREFSLLVQAWERADAGRFVHARVRSPAGLGKTRLLEEFTARLRALHARPVTIVTISGDLVHRNIGFGFAARLAGALGRTRGASSVSPLAASVLLGLEPSLADVFRGCAPLLPPAHDAARMRASALAELISSVASERRLAVLVDDVHWADPQSSQVLASAFAMTRGVPLLLVTCSRTGQDLELSAETEVELPPLSADSVRELCRSIADLPGAPWVERLVDGLHHGTGGSPFLVLQGLALVVERGVLRISDAGWECADSGALRSLVDGSSAVASRIAGLSHAEQFILLVGALSGGSIPASTLEKLARERTGSDAALSELESRGLILRVGSTLRPAHDELVAQAQQQAGAGACCAAHLVVAEQLSAHATGDPDTLREIGVHYYAAGERGRVAPLFERFVRARRASGDGRGALLLAREFLSEASAVELAALVRSLPLKYRQPHFSRYLAVAAIAIVLVFSGGAALRATREAPPAAFVWALLQGDDPWPIAAESIPVRPERFGTGLHIEAGRHPQIRLSTNGPDLARIALDPQHPRRWVGSAAVPDSGVTELFLVDNGRTRRLTNAPGDDIHPSWSPDGTRIAFATSRWNPSGQTDIALLDPATGEVQPLAGQVLRPARPGGEDFSDGQPAWSPGGSEIAYVHINRTSNRTAICRTTVDGRSTRCHELAAGPVIADMGWRDADKIAWSVEGSEGRARLTTITREGAVSVSATDWQPSDQPGLIGTGFSVLTRQRDELRGFGVALQSSGERTMEVRLSDKWKRHASLLLGTSTASHPYLDSLFVSITGQPAAGVPYQLAARGVDNLGRPIEPITLRWTLLGDSARARLTVDGLLDADAPGTYRVRVTAGGWRTTDALVNVGMARDSVVAVEDWTGDTWNRWRRFGAPLPLIDTDGKAPTLNVNGDGSFFSGVYQAALFDARDGIGVEVDLSTPVTMGVGQLIILGLSPASDSTNLATWDHLTGWPLVSSACAFQYPGGPDGVTKADFMQFLHTAGSARAPAPLRTGAWFHVRLQLLPDGRCVTALNGKVIGVSGASVSHPTDRRRVYFYGSSAKTKVRVGRTEVYLGVRGNGGRL